MAYSRRQIAQAQQLYKIASDAAYTHRAATHALKKLAAVSFADPDETQEFFDTVSGTPDLLSGLGGGDGTPSLLSKIKRLSASKFDSLQGSDLLKNLTKGQMAGGAALLAALGGGAYMYKKHRDKKRGEAEAEAGRAAEASRAAAELKRQEEAAAAIMAAKNLSEAQRKKLIRNLGIGAGTALGSYGLYRALR